MSDKSLSDNEKQEQLFQQIQKQLIQIGRLILGIILFISPFLSLFILEKIDISLSPEILVTPWGLIIPIVTVAAYLVFKKYIYGRLFR